MINKFQQGGKLQQLLDQIFAMINQQPEEALKQLSLSGAKPEDIAKLVLLGVQQGKIKPEVGKAIMSALQGQTQSARHGTKLQYLMTLKNKCPEGEELYYYKKGGHIGCGCKKIEDGGPVDPKKKPNVVNNFKKKRQDQATKDSISINKGNDELEAIRPGTYKPNPKYNSKDPESRTHIWVPDRTQPPYKKVTKKAKGGHTDLDALTRLKCGSKVKKESCGSKVVKAFKEKCGAKMKKK